MNPPNSLIIVASQDHPLYPLLKQSKQPLFEANSPDLHQQLHQSSLTPKSLLLEFTLKDRDEKQQWAHQLSQDFDLLMLLEGSHLWGEALLDSLPQAIGLHTGAFFSPTKKIELFLKTKEHQASIDSFFESLAHSVHLVRSPGIGFIYPRVISMIINEAYLALDDQLASPEALDTAMKFGVNYPLGPVDWKKRIGARPIVKLLDELLAVTGNPRYRVSPSLRRESLKPPCP